MPRKPKDIYARVSDKEEQIKQLKDKLLKCESELAQLNKERESQEMSKMFETAKEYNMSCKEVIELISKVHEK